MARLNGYTAIEVRNELPGRHPKRTSAPLIGKVELTAD